MNKPFSQDTRNIIFRADGGPDIGMGHVSRCLALAEMLSENFHCIFATRTPGQYQLNQIEDICRGHIALPEDDAHFDFFLAQLSGNEIVVLDNYFFDTDYQRAIRAKGCRLVCIDDMHEQHFLADVVINQAPGLDPAVYSTEKYTQLLLGLQYALLHKPFRQPIKSEGRHKYSCLIMMGAADPFGFGNRLLELLRDIPLSGPIAVVAPNKPFHENVVWYSGLSASAISLLMDESAFGILPASTVSIEACARGLAFVCGYYADNQLELYKGIEKEQLALCVGKFDALNSTALAAAVRTLQTDQARASIRDRQQALFDHNIAQTYIRLFKAL